MYRNYFGRIGQLFSETEEVVKIGVIHPLRSTWSVYSGREDEGILKEKGSVTDNGTLYVGECEYNTVVLPALYSVDQITAELLKKFVRNGWDYKRQK